MAKERVGECLRCGKCCLKVGFWLKDDDPDFLRWLSFHRGVEIKRYPSMPGDVCVEIKAPCKELDYVGYQRKTGRRLYMCKIYKKRPQLCLEWPYREEVLIEGCGFSYVEEEEE